MKFINEIKKKIRRNELTLGSWITIGHPVVAEIMAESGFDWLTIDLEHSAIDISHMQVIFQAIRGTEAIPLVRVGENNASLIKRAMDAGAYGVIVPMVNTRDSAERAVSAVKYPPMGTRGVGLSRAQGYGYEFDDYKESINENSIVIAQIEHIQAIENLEEILNVPGIDASIIGPYDLSGSLGYPGDF